MIMKYIYNDIRRIYIYNDNKIDVIIKCTGIVINLWRIENIQIAFTTIYKEST
jgi:hypothetical protein